MLTEVLEQFKVFTQQVDYYFMGAKSKTTIFQTPKLFKNNLHMIDTTRSYESRDLQIMKLGYFRGSCIASVLMMTLATLYSVSPKLRRFRTINRSGTRHQNGTNICYI